MNLIRSETGSHCNSLSIGVMWSYFREQVISWAVAFRTDWTFVENTSVHCTKECCSGRVWKKQKHGPGSRWFLWIRISLFERCCTYDQGVWWLLWCHFKNPTIHFAPFSYSLLVYVWKVRSILVTNSRNMPQRCVVGGCSYVRSSENGIVLHMIPFYSNERPEAKKRRKRLIDFLRWKQAGWDPSKSLVICLKHF